MYSTQLMQHVPSHSPRMLPLIAVAAVHVVAILGLANGLRLIDRPSGPQISSFVDVPDEVVRRPPPPEDLVIDQPAGPITHSSPPPNIPTADEPPVDVIRGAIDIDSGPVTPRVEPAGEGPFIPAKPLRRIEPRYPDASTRFQEQGVVVVLATIGINGRVTHVEIKSSSGYARLDQAALKSVRDWMFEPARRGDQAITQVITVPVRFELR